MKRAVRTLIRLVAAGLLIFGGMTIGLEYTRHRMKNADISPWHCIVGAVLIVLGVILFWASARLAEQLADDFEE